MWELRHGWPRPNRQTNGYRSYQPHLVADLQARRRLCESRDPHPQAHHRWAAEMALGTAQVPEPHRSPCPRHSAAPRRRHAARRIARRARRPSRSGDPSSWSSSSGRSTLRDEASAALAPALVAIAELQRDGRPLAEADALLHLIRDRCDALLRTQPRSPDPLLVVAARESDQPLAALTALILCFRGIPTQRWSGVGEPSAACIVASDDCGATALRHRIATTVSTLTHDERPSLWICSTRTGRWLGSRAPTR